MSDEMPARFAIDEFKALRDEVKRCESESLSITLYVFTAVVLAAGIADKPWLPAHVVPILVQTALLWAMHRFHMLNSLRVRLSTYIQVMLEPTLPGICWEGRNHAFEPFNKRRYYFQWRVLNWCLHRFSQVFFLLTAMGMYLSVNSVLRTQMRDFRFYVVCAILIALHLMSTLLMLKCVFLRPSASLYIEIWKSIKLCELQPNSHAEHPVEI